MRQLEVFKARECESVRVIETESRREGSHNKEDKNDLKLLD